jgi:hypothetical protein
MPFCVHPVRTVLPCGTVIGVAIGVAQGGSYVAHSLLVTAKNQQNARDRHDHARSHFSKGFSL